jgi:lipid-binding SYLF domain-containing protein
METTERTGPRNCGVRPGTHSRRALEHEHPTATASRRTREIGCLVPTLHPFAVDARKELTMTRIISIALLVVTACATAPKTVGDQQALERQAAATLQTMTQRAPGLDQTLRSAAGYAVFPNIGKGGFIAGAAYGRGILYQGGRQVGFVELNQGSLGAQIGAQTFAELVVFLADRDVQRVKNGQFTLGGNVSAVVLTAGRGASADFKGGIAVYVMPRGGVMAELSVSGQQINFQPMGG